jgi:hypothetical protein
MPAADLFGTPCWMNAHFEDALAILNRAAPFLTLKK